MAIRKTLDEVNKYIQSQGCIWIGGEYKNNRSYLKVQFLCGCIGDITFGNFKNGRRCYFHQREKAAKSRRISQEKIIDIVESYGFTFVEIISGFGRMGARIAYLCKFGHRTERDFKHFMNNPRCGICEKEKRKTKYVSTPNKIQRIIESRGCKLIDIKNYTNEKKSNLLINFSCSHRENLSMANFRGRRTGLCIDCEMESRRGETSYRWKGGLTPLTLYIRRNISIWNEECAQFYKYKCVVTNKPMDHIHHLQSFNFILIETIDELNLEIKKNISDYSSKELEDILNKFLEVQSRYSMGVPISTNVHRLFHRMYGRGNNTPDQFYEFQSRIASGKIQIPD